MREVVVRLDGVAPSLRFLVHETGDLHVSESIATRGVWEPFESELVRRVLEVVSGKERPIFIDCGANIGWYSVLAGALGAKVLAFEPMPANARLLRQNLDRNDFPGGVRLYELALGERRGQAELHLSKNNQGDHRLHVGMATDPTKQRQTATVTVDRLDAVLEPSLSRPHVIKLDTQGSEVAVLRGATNAWLPAPGLHDVVIFTEFWPYGLARCGSSGDELLELLQPLIGSTHRCFEIQEWKASLVPLTRDGLSRLVSAPGMGLDVRGFTNLLLIPEELAWSVAGFVAGSVAGST